ncbi:MAG TPA: glycosyl hydrolase 115 family protein [Chitinophagaceae bacterium]
MKKGFIILVVIVLTGSALRAQDFITVKKEAGAFPLVPDSGATATLYTDKTDDWLVQKSASLLQQDIQQVTGARAALVNTLPATGRYCIIIGTIGKSALIQRLAKEKKINTDTLKGKWEAYLLQVVAHPLPGIDQAFVIAGSDRRGAAYGVFELSRQLGVSPWYWWADVPVKKKKAVYIRGNTYKFDKPGVKYRGIFINDEAPAFSGWAKEKFGGVNHNVYEKIFELLLRLKANYLWPAMWGNAFNDDDPLNPILADQYGIVMGTSHHEPMLRAQQEWKRYGKGEWNYQTNDTVLRAFWKKGIENMGTHESIVTVGMRGDGDKPMTEGTATALLEKIVADQRKIIEEVTHKPAAQTPQLWALYKEVQAYYDKGMRVPDDITLLLCDDNWGNLRKLPRLDEKPRKGGYGIYYHFDYVGDPRNYKWLNTNSIPRVWEQMHLAWEYKVRDIWIVNVGDLKPMEFPISFFLDYAWNPPAIHAEDLQHYTEQWSAEQFGSKYASDIAAIISAYSKYNARRKPELLSPDTYSLDHYEEAETVVRDYKNLLVKAEDIGSRLPATFQDAYFELVLHPVKACANLNELYLTVAKNRSFAAEHMAIANELADKAKQLFINDSLISYEYNHDIAHGKWDHMMDQTHIGYTWWQQPPFNTMPEVRYVPADSIRHFDLRIDTTSAFHPDYLEPPTFTELEGAVSINATHFSKAVNSKTIHWKIIPDLGKTASAITPFPVTAPEQTPGGTSPHLEYKVYVKDTGSVQLLAYFSPTLNFHNSKDGLQYAISIDGETPQIISINKDDNVQKTWEGWVADNIIIKSSSHTLHQPGIHTIKYWMVSPAVVLQKLVMDLGGLKPSYLGPPETRTW